MNTLLLFWYLFVLVFVFFFILENITCTVASLLLLLAKIAQKCFSRLLLATRARSPDLGLFRVVVVSREVLRNGEVVRERRG